MGPTNPKAWLYINKWQTLNPVWQRDISFFLFRIDGQGKWAAQNNTVDQYSCFIKKWKGKDLCEIDRMNQVLYTYIVNIIE